MNTEAFFKAKQLQENIETLKTLSDKDICVCTYGTNGMGYRSITGPVGDHLMKLVEKEISRLSDAYKKEFEEL